MRQLGGRAFSGGIHDVSAFAAQLDVAGLINRVRNTDVGKVSSGWAVSPCLKRGRCGRVVYVIVPRSTSFGDLW